MQHQPQEAAQWHRARRRRRRRGCAALVLTPVVVIGMLFGWFGLRLLAQPTVSRDYLAEINAASEQVAEADRAWPLYKQAILFKIEHPMPDALMMNRPIYPGWAQWDEAKAWLDEIEPALDLVREAAKRPALGKPMSAEMDEEIARAEATSRGGTYTPEPPEDKPALLMVLLPELGYMRTFALDLTSDTFRAMEDADTDRAIENIEASLQIAEHAAESRTIIGQLVQIAIEHLTAQNTLRVIDQYPNAFTADDLARLQDAFMTIGRGPMPEAGGLTRLTLDNALERVSFYDIVQRTYSDDGHGNGYLTLEGVKKLNSFVSISGEGGVMDAETVIPGVLLAASRKDLIEKYDEMMDRFEARAALQPWEREPAGSLDAEIGAMHGDPLTRSRYILISVMLPALERATVTIDQANARRDGTIAAIALHRWRADHGSFPDRLKALVPEYLPRLPLDPVDGQPLRYLLKADGPVLYSLGADGDDDGGTPGEDDRKVLPGNSDTVDGDWVLSPVPPVEEPVDE